MEKERIDTRKLEPAAREQLRKTAIRMHGRGQSQITISETLGVRRSTITIWIGKARNGDGTREAKRGRAVGEFRVLTAAQEHRIRQDIVDKTPDQMKLSFALWNAQAVRAYIKQGFLIDLPIRSVRRYLNRWGFTPQRPLKKAFEQKPEARRLCLSLSLGKQVSEQQVLAEFGKERFGRFQTGLCRAGRHLSSLSAAIRASGAVHGHQRRQHGPLCRVGAV